MAKKRRKKARKANPSKKRRAPRRRNPYGKGRASRASHRRSGLRRRRNPAGGFGLAAGAVGLAVVTGAVVYGALAFSTSLSPNMKAGIGAGVGIAGGLLVGMASPELGVGVASGGLAVAASQFAAQEVAAYQATQQQASTTPTPSSGVNGVNGWPQARAMGSGY